MRRRYIRYTWTDQLNPIIFALLHAMKRSATEQQKPPRQQNQVFVTGDDFRADPFHTTHASPCNSCVQHNIRQEPFTSNQQRTETSIFTHNILPARQCTFHKQTQADTLHRGLLCNIIIIAFSVNMFLLLRWCCVVCKHTGYIQRRRRHYLLVNVRVKCGTMCAFSLSLKVCMVFVAIYLL